MMGARSTWRIGLRSVGWIELRVCVRVIRGLSGPVNSSKSAISLAGLPWSELRAGVGCDGCCAEVNMQFSRARCLSW